MYTDTQKDGYIDINIGIDRDIDKDRKRYRDGGIHIDVYVDG